MVSSLPGSTAVPGLSSFCPSTNTMPDMIMAWAFARDSARPFSVSRTSSRSLFFMGIAPCRSDKFSGLFGKLGTGEAPALIEVLHIPMGDEAFP